MSIAKNTVYNLAGSLVPVVVSLASVPLYLDVIGLERYGILALCWLMLGFMGFLKLGLGPAVAQRIAKLRDADEEPRAEVFWTAFWINLSIGLAGGVLVYLLAPVYFATVPGMAADVRAEVDACIPWLAATIPAVMMSGVLNGALQGRERFLAVNLISSAIFSLMTLVPLGIAYAFGPHLERLVASVLAVRLLSLLMLYWVCARAVPLHRPRFLDTGTILPLLSFGGWITAANIVGPLLAAVGRFAIGAMLGAAAVSIYVVPHSLVSRLRLLPEALASVLFPRFAYTSREGSARLQADSAAALSSLLTPIAVAALIAIGPFLILWVGREIAVQSAPVAYILLAGFWANGFARIPNAYLQGIGRPDLVTKLLAAYAIPYLILLYLCLSTFGVVGAAMVLSLRMSIDPVALFILARLGRTILPTLVVPALLVYSAAAVALFLPMGSTFRWIGLTLILAGSLLWSAYTFPEVLRTRLKASLPTRMRRAPRASTGSQTFK